MQNRERGSGRPIVIGFIALVLLVLAGAGFYAVKHPVKISDEKYTGKKTKTVYIATTTTSYIATTTTEVVQKVKPLTTSNPAPRIPSTGSTQSATAYRAVSSGPAYHNNTFGLTVPGSYSVTQGRNVYAGVPNMTSLNFYQGGVLAFTVNVFSKEQWNDIRIQETINKDNGNEAGTYFGEGFYLGENFTWIYSYIPGSYAVPTGVRFY